MTGTIPDPLNPYATSWRLYADRGWRGILPVTYQDKATPPGEFTGYDGKWPTDGRLARWADEGVRNIVLRLPDDVIGIDVDQYVKKGKQKNGATQLAEFEAAHGVLPATWSSTRREADGPSRIRFYRVPAGTQFPEKIAADIDVIQFGHRYAVVWPSVVPDEGNPDDILLYAWYDPNFLESDVPPRPEDLTLLPDHLIEAMRAAGPIKSKQDEGKTAKKTGPELYLPPGDPGRTNEWLTKVAGRLAIAFRHSEIEYMDVMRLVDSSSADPHAQFELEKTARSVWKREQGKQVPGAGSEVTGYLYSNSGRLLLDDKDGDPHTFGNFDVRVIGKVRAADGTLDGYNVTITNDRTKKTTEAYLPRKVLSDPRQLHGWLSAYEITILSGISGGVQPHTRLQAYLSAQPARDIRIVPFWGWDDQVQGFVTDRGVIRASGLEADPSVKPDPHLVQRGLVRHNYGFDFDEVRAAAILQEILTFQDETVTSVVGAWWVATKLKGQIMQSAALFPVLVIEAASESGKTTGFFELLYKLDGNLGEASVNSPAAFRNRLAAHRNGIVWYDDPRELDERTREYIRNATAENEATKSDTTDNVTLMSMRLVAPILLSGEGFGLGNEKALADRVIQIGLPSPKGRMSLYDPTRSQWEDIIDFKRVHPNLTMATGTLVAMILAHANVVEELPSLRPGSGRYADKIAILRVGARVLAKITGDSSHIDRVDAWCGIQIDRGNENTLTMSMIPTCFRFVGVRDKPEKRPLSPFHGVPTPVLVRPDKTGVRAVWVSPEHLADWWGRQHKTGTEVRTQTAEALRDQAHAIKMKGQSGESGLDWWKTRVKNDDGSVSYVVYWRVPDQEGSRILADMNDDDAETSTGRLSNLRARSETMRKTRP